MVLIRRTLDVLGLLTLLVLCNASTVTYASQDNEAGDKPENIPWPTLPSVELSIVDKFEDEASYLADTASRIAELEQQAAQASNEQQKVELLLAVANQVLAYQLEPVISRQLLGLRDEAKADDQTPPSSMLAHVRELLKTSETIIESIGQGELEDEQQAQLNKAKRQLKLLRSFAAGVEALTNAELDQASPRETSSRLSILREDSDRAVMSAAGLWQAIVRSKMDDPARALDVLPLALAQVRLRSQAHSFFARILRCELLSKQGKYAASLALLNDIEELSSDWFVQKADQAAAARTAAWMQLAVLKSWHRSLKEQGNESETQWCAHRANSIIERRFAGDEMMLLRMVPAVPIVATGVEAGDKDAASSESSKESSSESKP